MPSYWLIVERYENWNVDRAENFRRFGLPERSRNTAAKINPGDLLVVYVSGKNCFSDVRRVISPTIAPLKLGGPYDAAFAFALSTEPFITPTEENWIRVQQLADRLIFLSRTDWRQSFRNSIRPIPEVDGKLIQSLFEQGGQIAAQKPNSATTRIATGRLTNRQTNH